MFVAPWTVNRTQFPGGAPHLAKVAVVSVRSVQAHVETAPDRGGGVHPVRMGLAAVFCMNLCVCCVVFTCFALSSSDGKIVQCSGFEAGPATEQHN